MVIDKNGIKCNCGKNGCYETFASMKRFKARAIEELGLDKNLLGEEVQNYIRENINKEKSKQIC